MSDDAKRSGATFGVLGWGRLHLKSGTTWRRFKSTKTRWSESRMGMQRRKTPTRQAIDEGKRITWMVTQCSMRMDGIAIVVVNYDFWGGGTFGTVFVHTESVA